MSAERAHDKPLSPDEHDRYIIERLRKATEPLSGELLSAELGMSRVALWKRVESLKAWGYGIDASRKGYTLVRDDGLAGWEIDAPGPVLLFDTVGSTMDEARSLAAGGAVSGATVLALGQSAGRGLGGRPWVSPAGGLYISVVLRSALPPASAGALSLEASAITLRVLNEAGAAALTFRWPNDIVLAGASGSRPSKVGGVLVEPHGDLGHADFYVVGIGLSTAPLELADSAASARRASLAAAIVAPLVDWVDEPVLDAARWAWMAPRGSPAGEAVARVVLWNGTERRLVPLGFGNHGELIPADGGQPVSIGECRAIYFEGESL
jgi:biotin operon repressor BirA-like protein